MNYLSKRGNRFYYYRRVPDLYREYDPRIFIRKSLNTTCQKQALRLALQHNDHIELYWQKLIGSGQKHSEALYQDAVSRAQLFGFTYMPAHDLAQLPIEQIISRLLSLDNAKLTNHRVEAVLGGVQPPSIKLDDALEKYFTIAKDKLLNKSENQTRKWYAPRRRAIKNLIACIGNKKLSELNRNDLLKFRDHWINRIKTEDLVTNSANKDFIHIKMIVETISDNLKLELDTKHIFRKLLLKEDDERQRVPFETSFINDILLNSENLKGLNHQARCALMAIAETGAGPSEQVGLLEEDIILDHEIPHIIITPRSKKILKTKYRKRIIPLVGYALQAFKECPSGFTHYHDSPDRLSAVLNKYLSAQNMLPTERHSVYSLRHSFQDRLLAANTPDRIQAELMGHKFNRQSYGNGSTLEHKQKWLKNVCLKNH